MSLVFSSMKMASRTIMSMKDPQITVPALIHGYMKERIRKAEEIGVIETIEDEGEGKEEADEISSQSSSIGAFSFSSADGEEKGEEIQSKFKDEGSLDSLIFLEESLPSKRGLSNFFSGKSRSFASLSDATSSNARDLVKPENAFNKRRRILATCKASWKRRASCTLLANSSSPFLSSDLVKEDVQKHEDDEEAEPRGRGFPLVPLSSLRKNFKNSRSQSLSEF